MLLSKKKVWDVVNGKSTWIVENHGIDPDIEIDNRPDAFIEGRDPQLERGIAIVNEELAKHPIVKPHRDINPPQWPTDCPGDKFPFHWLHGKFD